MLPEGAKEFLGQEIQMSAPVPPTALEYFPAAQRAHKFAPLVVGVLELLLVIDPGGQSVQADAAEAVEYLPAAQDVHEDAPLAAPVLVTDPGSHVMQSDAELEPVLPVYVPAAHSVQSA